MKKLILAAIASVALSACTAASLAGTAVSAAATAADIAHVAPPVTYCDKTLLDEHAGAAVELAYAAWRTALELATDAGLVKGQRAVSLAAVDNRAYAATLATQAAYDACNATGYRAAATEATAALKQALAVLKGQ